MPTVNNAEAAKAPAKPVAPKGKPAAKPKKPEPKEEPGRLVVHPTIEATIHEREDAITAELMAQLLGWEDEETYAARMKAEAEESGVKLAKGKLEFGDDYLLKDEFGRKVRCWNNDGNRDFDEGHCRRLAQDILTKNWADSRHGGTVKLKVHEEHGGGEQEFPELTLNGETMVISRTGVVKSMQHRGPALILAAQKWSSQHPESAHWREVWGEVEPSIEGIIVTGVSDDPRVAQTYDNTKPRSLADVVCTSGVFRKLKPADRREANKMMAAAIDLLWNRTLGGDNPFQSYRTNSTMLEFLGKHRSLEKCVKHLLEVNRVTPEGGRGISNLKLSPGQCAGLMYLFAAANTDIDAGYLESRSEKQVDLSLWDKADEFFVLLGDDHPDFRQVREAIAGLQDVEEGLGGRVIEKHAILIKAWAAFSVGEAITEETVSLVGHYHAKDDGGVAFIDPPLIGGIDQGVKLRKPDPEPTAEEIEAQKQAEKQKHLDEMKETAKAGKGKGKGAGSGTPKDDVKAMIDRLAKEHHGKLLLYRNDRSKGYTAYGDSADEVAEKTFVKLVSGPLGINQAFVSDTEWDKALAALTKAGHRVGIVAENGTTVTDLSAAPKAEPKAAPVPAPKAKAPAPKKPAGKAPLRGGV